MKLRALLLVMLVLLAILPAALQAGASETGERGSGPIAVKLFAQLSATDSSLSTQRSSSSTRAVDSIDFPSVDLEDSLMVRGVETGVGLNKGFEVRIGVTNPGLQETRATVQVRDDDTVIANKTMVVPSLETRWDWRLPFTVTKDTHSFARGHSITLRISSERNIFVRTDSDSYLELICQDHLAVSTETRDTDNKRVSKFYPNDLIEERHVVFRGDLVDAFGSTDIGGVNITVRRPDGQTSLENQAATVTTEMNYSYDWNYPNGLPSGTYTINVTARDRQGHEFSTQGSFIMAEYGVRMSAEGEVAGVVTKGTTPGNIAKYTLTVLNIGGKSANIVMDRGAEIPLWPTSFSKSSFILVAGNDEDVTFDVQPSSILGGGNESKYVVTTTVSNDPGTPKAKAVIEVETFVRNEVALVVTPEKPDPKTVGVGGTVDHTFNVRNQGEFSTNVDLTAIGVTTGWTVEFSGTRVEDNAIANLRSMEVVEVVLRVRAPSTSESKKLSVKVRCQSREYTDIFVERTFETRLVIGLVLTPSSPLTTVQDPGGVFTLYYEARNNDPTADHNISFSVEQRASSWPSSSFKFTPSTLVKITKDGKVNMGMEVTVPQNAEAGTHRFTLRGVVDGKSQVSTSFDFNVTINVRHELEVDLDPSRPQVSIGTQEESIVFLTIRNRGNVAELVNVTVDVDDDNVVVRMNDARTPIILNMRIEPSDSVEIKISFKATSDAFQNDEFTVRIQVKRSGDPTPISPGDFKLKVEKSTNEVFMDLAKKFGIMALLLVVMAIAMVYRPSRRRPEVTEAEDKTTADHGTMVRH